MGQNTDNRILIHACCGICSGYPISLLRDMGYEPVVYFCNPNLDSKEEFERRLKAQKIVCMYHWVDLIVEEYNHNDFLRAAIGLENEPERGKRCDECIKLRLKMTAEKAKESLKETDDEDSKTDTTKEYAVYNDTVESADTVSDNTQSTIDIKV